MNILFLPFVFHLLNTRLHNLYLLFRQSVKPALVKFTAAAKLVNLSDGKAGKMVYLFIERGAFAHYEFYNVSDGTSFIGVAFFL